jgi:hypothetical protein
LHHPKLANNNFTNSLSRIRSRILDNAHIQLRRGGL